MPSIQHLVETQFSVRMGPDLTPEWLEGRVALLRQFTVPSMEAQTSDAFTWLLLCDETTHPAVLEQLRAEARRLPMLKLVMTSETRSPLEAVRDEVQRDADVLITTRLDSDDAVADRYLEATQDYAESFHRSSAEVLLVNFPHGYKLDTSRRLLYEDWMPNSSFHSLLERPRSGAPRTVRAAGHTDLRWVYGRYQRLRVLGEKGVGAPHVRLHQHYPTQQDVSMPGWLIVVHGGNMINCVGTRERLVSGKASPDGFTLAPKASERTAI